ncbi:hypothetical protein NPIL_203361 [Nephila pilipes]|uniref:Uncharacterized protein n=1 Tax=Nephila pilipes TaxID=299642 RepID=A0A8X6Q701_NEPPI|nr:hypothetical protein NPIL_203361 [Nephila pilipes]
MTKNLEIVSIVVFSLVLQVTAFFRSHYPLPVPFRTSEGYRHTSNVVHIPVYQDRLIIVKKPGSHHLHQAYDHGHIHNFRMNREPYHSLGHELWHRYNNDHPDLRYLRGASLLQDHINDLSRLPTVHWRNKVNLPLSTESVWLRQFLGNPFGRF